MRRAGSWFVAYSPVILLVAFAAYLLCGCGVPVAAPAATEPSTTLPKILEIHAQLPVPPIAVAVRVDPPTTTTTIAPFDAVAYVNGLPYAVLDMNPVREAYRIVASYRGWDTATIAKWEPFIVDDVIHGESVGCWNLRGGATVEGEGHGCELTRQGTHSDSGFFQLVSLWYQPGGPLCVHEGYCSSDSIIATPWDSMNAGLYAVEYQGSRSWCFAPWAIAFHPGCNSITRSWP